MSKSHNCYDLSKSGLEHWLGPLEARVMDVLWSSDRRPLPLQRVWRELGSYEWAMTTIQTTLNRLVAKGLVGRNSDQPVYRYFAIMPRAAWERENVERLLNSLAEEYGDVVDAWLEREVQT